VVRVHPAVPNTSTSSLAYRGAPLAMTWRPIQRTPRGPRELKLASIAKYPALSAKRGVWCRAVCARRRDAVRQEIGARIVAPASKKLAAMVWVIGFAKENISNT
jgi:hypothetical protein